MKNFGERLRGVALCAGMAKPETIAQLVQVEPDWVERWMVMNEAPRSFRTLSRFAVRVGVKPSWLATGDGSPYLSHALQTHEREILSLASQMEAKTLRMWINIGHKLIER